MASEMSSTADRSKSKSPVAVEPVTPTLAYWLSGVLAVATLIASAAGFFITDLFQRDNVALGGCARGTALVILTVALPTLIISMVLAARGSLRARLVWMGILAYILYNSVYFTFSATFNRFFLAFLVMLSLSLWSLVSLLLQWDARKIKDAFGSKTPVRFTSIILLLPVLIFLLTDLRETITATVTDSLPPTIIDTQLPTNHFHIMDLAVLVPLFLAAAIWLWQRRAWGYTLAGVLLTFYTVELLGISADQWFGGLADPQSPLANASVMPAFLVGALAFLAVLVFFLRSLRDRDLHDRVPTA